MWIIIAVACSNPSAASCLPLILQNNSFDSEMHCVEFLPRAQMDLSKKYTYALASCVEKIGNPNV